MVVLRRTLSFPFKVAIEKVRQELKRQETGQATKSAMGTSNRPSPTDGKVLRKIVSSSTGDQGLGEKDKAAENRMKFTDEHITAEIKL